MLYFKADANGNPQGLPQTEAEIKAEYLSQGTIIPLATDWLVENGYAELPVGEPMPMAPLGQKTVPDIPVKNADGTYSRRWKFVEITTPELTVEDKEARAKMARATYLKTFVDSISPLRWNAWTPEQQAEVTEWYQKVLNLPNNPAWPDVALPELPTPIKG